MLPFFILQAVLEELPGRFHSNTHFSSCNIHLSKPDRSYSLSCFSYPAFLFPSCIPEEMRVCPFPLVSGGDLGGSLSLVRLRVSLEQSAGKYCYMEHIFCFLCQPDSIAFVSPISLRGIRTTAKVRNLLSCVCG
jgi:hypothetical protein